MPERMPGEQPERVELATEATKKAFLERIKTAIKDVVPHGSKRNDYQIDYVFEKDNYNFEYIDESQSQQEEVDPRSVVGRLWVTTTIKEETFKHTIYTLRNEGTIDYYVQEDAGGPLGEGSQEEKFIRWFFDQMEKARLTQQNLNQMGMTLVTEKELQGVNALIDRVIEKGTKRK